MPHRFLYISLLFLCFGANAQYRQYVFTHLSAKDGLASVHVYSILQDKRGFMWFATANGLQRYDGRKIISFRPGPSDTSFLPTEVITQIHLDKKNRFWLAGNNNTIGFFNTTHFRFKVTPAQSRKAEKTYIN